MQRRCGWAVVSLALMACVCSAADKEKGTGKGARPAGPRLEEGTAVPNAGVLEPSGITFHARLGRFFVVGDEGSLAELDAQGGFVRSTALGGNLEDVVVHEPSGSLVVLSETPGELMVVDPGSRQVVSRWRLDSGALLGTAAKGGNGFEGLGFRPQAGRPGGGVFYLAHQRGPALVVEVAFDPAGPGGTLSGAAVLGRWPLAGMRDLNAITWAPALERLLVLSDGEDQVLLVDAEGGASGRVTIPGLQQEGLWLDGSGTLWVADDRGARVTRHAGALDALRAAMSGPQPPARGDGQGNGKKKKKKD